MKKTKRALQWLLLLGVVALLLQLYRLHYDGGPWSRNRTHEGSSRQEYENIGDGGDGEEEEYDEDNDAAQSAAESEKSHGNIAVGRGSDGIVDGVAIAVRTTTDLDNLLPTKNEKNGGRETIRGGRKSIKILYLGHRIENETILTSQHQHKKKRLQYNLTDVVLANQKKRMQLLTNFCAHNTRKYRKSFRHVVYNKKKKFAYCKIGKVASSAWSGLLKKACGDSSLGSKSKKLRELRGSGTNLYKFVFVRHPFDRIHSAYRSKFLRSKSSYLKRLAPKIIRRYRKDVSTNSSGGHVTFEEFVAYLVEPRRKPLVDFHWSPQVSVCPPCSRIHYDFIGHYETLYEDSDHVLGRLGISSRFNDRTRIVDWTRRVREVYSNVSFEHRNRLKQLYRLDFHAYGYDPDVI